MAKSKVTRACHECHQPFQGWTGGAGKYCSVKCYHAGDRRRAVERFWRRVIKTNTCWNWTGPTDHDGHGRAGIGSVHQIAWIEINGPIPRPLQVLHRCNNPVCVNPDHLYLGTPADNMRDRQKAGHYDRGESHPMAIVDEETVKSIRATYVPRKNGGIVALGKRHGIAPSTVHAIVSRRIWRHI